MIRRKIFYVCLFVLIPVIGISAPRAKIKEFVVNYDVAPDLDLRRSLDKYLSRYVNQEASNANYTAARKFLEELYFVSQAKCHDDQGNQIRLVCDLKLKRIIGDIIIHNLPASLLEGELVRKLPIQLGHTVDFDETFDQSLSLVKGRVETFLKKNGVYGAQVRVKSSARPNSLLIDVLVEIKNGVFARVNDVTVMGDPPMSVRAIKNLYRRMCFSFNRIIEAMSIGTLSCYSRELERETTQGLLDRFAKMGYVQSHIRISQHWVDPSDKSAPKSCQKTASDDLTPRCINLRIEIDKGQKLRFSVNVKDRLAIDRNGFARFLGSIFSAQQISRASIPPESDETPLDHMIIKEELNNEITFIPAKNVDEQEITESAKAITEFLVAQGYVNAEVVPSFVQEDENNVIVNFDVYAGKPHFIESVRILPESFRAFITDEALQELVATRSLTHNGHLSYPEIESVTKELEDRLIAKGFSNITIKTSMESRGLGGVEIVFNIASDAREVVDEVIVLNGIGEINEEAMATLYNCDNYKPPRRSERQRKLCSGSSLARDKLEVDANRLIDHYQNHAFFYVKVKHEIASTDKGIKVIFTMYDSRDGESALRPLRKQSIKDIIVSGNRRTNANVIKRLFSRERRTGLLDPLALKRGLSYVRESGRFSRIDHKIIPGEEGSDDSYFLLSLAERPSLSIDTSVAFSTDKYFSFENELEESNLFSSMLRLNTSLALGLFWGRQSIFSNKLTWPFVFGKPVRFTITAPIIVYDDLSHLPTPSRRLQSKVSLGVEWRLTSRITPYVQYWFGVNQEDSLSADAVMPSFGDRINSLDGLIPTSQRPGEVRGVLKPGISYVNLDNPFDPRLGTDMNWWTEFSGGPFVGDPPFVNVGTQNRFYFPIGPLTIAVQATFMRAFIQPNRNNWKHLKNWSSMDSLGGDRSIRGYYEGRVGIYDFNGSTDVLAGYFSNIANLEIRFPLTTGSSVANFSGALFVDQGTLIPCGKLLSCVNGSSLQDLGKDSGFGLSVGAALRYALPVGPISFDYGISPITGHGRIHVLFGYAF